ncbi:hypothetical protein HK405_013516 [Cladochytrium tenue]|nr:hypothetical protein HK405_013516 [Cladochytrium tenue]
MPRLASPHTAAAANSSRCVKGFFHHDVFISYRVHADAAFAIHLCGELNAELDAARRQRLHAFLDRRCLIGGAEYAPQFQRALDGARVIVLCVSEDALADAKRIGPSSLGDSVLLEWEFSFRLFDQGKVEILPLFIGTRDDKTDSFRTFNFGHVDPSLFPETPNPHPLSERSLTVRQLVTRVLSIQGVSVFPNEPEK